MDDRNSQMVTQMPPLEPGESEITVFHTGGAGPSPGPAPAALLQGTNKEASKASTVRVGIATMGRDHLLQKSEVQLRVNTTISAAPSSWTSTLKEVGGRLDEHEASCDNGNFICTGDGNWCAEQQDILCQAAVDAQPAATEPTAEIMQDAAVDSEPAVAEANAEITQDASAPLDVAPQADPHASKSVKVTSQPVQAAHTAPQKPKHVEVAKFAVPEVKPQPSKPVEVAKSAVSKDTPAEIPKRVPQPSKPVEVKSAEIPKPVSQPPKPVEVASKPDHVVTVSSKSDQSDAQNEHVETAKDEDADADADEDDEVWSKAASAAKAIKARFGFMQRQSHVQGHLKP
jgi:hypothetical protein